MSKRAQIKNTLSTIIHKFGFPLNIKTILYIQTNVNLCKYMYAWKKL